MRPTAVVPAPEPPWGECLVLLEELPRLPVASRLEAFERLVRSSSPGIRCQALRLGAAILTEDRLASYLRNDADAVLRNAGLEILKMRGGRGFSLAVELLRAADPDVVLQAVGILDHLKDPRAFEPLRALLDHADPNVVQSAIVAIGHLGDARAIPDLIPFLGREPWVQMAAVEALGDLRSAEAARPLARLLPDLIVGPMAAEALARIGGSRTFRALGLHWLRFEADLDAEPFLGFLAHVREGLARAPAPIPGLRESLAARLSDANDAARRAAARCLLAMGAGPQDEAALALLAETADEAGSMPACLRRRRDLAPALLGRPAPQRGWGLRLAARAPGSIAPQALAAAMAEVADPREIAAVADCLRRSPAGELAAPTLDLYLRLPVELRGALADPMRRQAAALGPLVDRRADLPPATRLVVEALLGRPAERLAARLAALSPEALVPALSQILDRRDLLRRLPWREWLEADARRFGPLAAAAAVKGELRDLLPGLRGLLDRCPEAPVVRALGELGDRESVPALCRLAERDPHFLPLVLESLGEVGGAEARAALCRALRNGDEVVERVAYRALSICATEEEEPLFRQAVAHPDWNVRLAAAMVLGRSARAENLFALGQLAADPVAIVSQRALSYLEP